MKNNLPGRNDPCHCGSGKKYKNCCLEIDELLGTDCDLFERHNRLITRCKMKLDNEFGAQIKKMRHDLLQHFLQFSSQKELDSQHETLFSDWLWFDLLDSHENSLAYNYLNAARTYLQEPLQECLASFMMSYLSVYEPTEVLEKQLKVKDIFTGQENLVLLKESFDEDIASNPLLLLGRQLHFREGSVFSGMVLIIRNDDGQKNFILAYIDYLKALMKEDKMVNVLKFQTEIIYGVFDHAYHKKVLSLVDLTVYNLTKSEGKSIKEEITSSKIFKFDYQAAKIDWFAMIDHDYPVKIGLSEDYLLACADQIDDIQTLQNFCSKLLPEQEPRIIHSVFLKQRPPEDLLPLWFEIMKDRESERWLHTPHEELDNQTPLEVLKTENGQNQLIQMLARFEDLSGGGKEAMDLIQHMRLRVQQYK